MITIKNKDYDFSNYLDVIDYLLRHEYYEGLCEGDIGDLKAQLISLKVTMNMYLKGELRDAIKATDIDNALELSNEEICYKIRENIEGDLLIYFDRSYHEDKNYYAKLWKISHGLE